MIYVFIAKKSDNKKPNKQIYTLLNSNSEDPG